VVYHDAARPSALLLPAADPAADPAAVPPARPDAP